MALDMDIMVMDMEDMAAMGMDMDTMAWPVLTTAAMSTFIMPRPIMGDTTAASIRIITAIMVSIKPKDRETPIGAQHTHIVHFI